MTIIWVITCQPRLEERSKQGTISISHLRTAYVQSGSIDGFQKELNPRMMPLFDAKNSGEKQISMHAGINSFINQGSLKGLRLGLEAGYVGYQKATGIQMRQKMQWTIGVQYVFGGTQ